MSKFGKSGQEPRPPSSFGLGCQITLLGLMSALVSRVEETGN